MCRTRERSAIPRLPALTGRARDPAERESEHGAAATTTQARIGIAYARDRFRALVKREKRQVSRAGGTRSLYSGEVSVQAHGSGNPIRFSSYQPKVHLYRVQCTCGPAGWGKSHPTQVLILHCANYKATRISYGPGFSNNHVHLAFLYYLRSKL